MKKSRFSEEKIISILREADAGVKVAELVRKHGISPATYYQWKAKFGGLDVSQFRKRPANTPCVARLISARAERRRASRHAAAVPRADARA